MLRLLPCSFTSVSSEMVADADLGYSRTEQQTSSFETGGASRDGGRSSSTSKRAQSTTNVIDEYSRGSIALYGQGIGSTPCFGYSPVLSHSGSAVSSEMVADDDDGKDIDGDGSFGDGIADYFGFGGTLQEKDLEYYEIPPTLLEVKLAKRLVVERFGCYDHDESHAGKGFIDDGDM